MNYICPLMKLQLIHLTMAFLMLFQSMGLSVSNIFQVDEFIQHYQNHKLTEGDSILEFVQDHYFSKDTHTHNDFSHNDLPFKTSMFIHFVVAIKSEPSHWSFNSIKQIVKQKFLNSNEFYYSLFPADITQPPI